VGITAKACDPTVNQPRFYCPGLTPGTVTLSQVETRHALVSLRLRAGEVLTLFDGRGHVAHGTLEAERDRASDTGKRRKVRAVVTVRDVQTVPRPQRTLTLIVAASKGPRLTWMVEKLTELGVTRIVLADFECSVVHAGETHVEKLRRTAIEACKQCGRAWLPEIESGIALRDSVAPAGADHLLITHPDERAPSLGVWLREHAGGTHLAVVVGPEGGLTPTELEMLETAGGLPARLGDHILRVETAAVAVAANWAAGPAYE
jgi:16S rRNA (uracil1498-N3)-methyltransferase